MKKKIFGYVLLILLFVGIFVCYTLFIGWIWALFIFALVVGLVYLIKLIDWLLS
jgi:hypothetical protein